MKKLTALVLMIIVLGGCSGAPPSTGVPKLSTGQSSGAPGATGSARKAALHAAADCIRRNGVPNYEDPVLTSDGHVYTDVRSIQDVDKGDPSGPTRKAVARACASQIAAAQFQPDEVAPAPPKLVQAGVKVAECMRAHGMSNVKDPTSATPFTPGHGFGMTADQLPAGGKADPAVQRAAEACNSLIDEEARQSSLGSLGDA